MGAAHAEEEGDEEEEEDGEEEEEGEEGTSLYCCGKGSRRRKKRQQLPDTPSSPILSRSPPASSREEKDRPPKVPVVKKEDLPHRSSPKKPIPSPRQSPIAAVNEASITPSKDVMAHKDDILPNDNTVTHVPSQESQNNAAEAKNGTSCGSSPLNLSNNYSSLQDKRSKVTNPNSSPLLTPKVSSPNIARKADGCISVTPAHFQLPSLPQESIHKHLLNSPVLSQKIAPNTETPSYEEELKTSQSIVKAVKIPTEDSTTAKDLRQVALNRHQLQSSLLCKQLPTEEIEDEQPLIKPQTKRGGPETGIPDGEVLSGAWTELCGLLVRLEACSPGAVRGGPHSTEFDAVDAGGGLGRMALEARRLVTESKMLIRAATFAIGGGRALSPVGKHVWPGTTSPISSPTSSRAPQVVAQQLETQELHSSLDLHLNQCLLLLNRLTQLCEASSSGPGWQVARKVADVTVAFGEAVRVVAGWVGGSGETGDTSAIECAAEGLAGALASLLRSLRVVPR